MIPEIRRPSPIKTTANSPDKIELRESQAIRKSIKITTPTLLPLMGQGMLKFPINPILFNSLTPVNTSIKKSLDKGNTSLNIRKSIDSGESGKLNKSFGLNSSILSRKSIFHEP